MTPVQPPLTLFDAGTPEVSVALGLNRSSAVGKALTREVVTRPLLNHDFNDDLNYWVLSNGSYLRWSWDGFTNAVLEGLIPRGVSSDSAGLSQDFVVKHPGNYSFSVKLSISAHPRRQFNSMLINITIASWGASCVVNNLGVSYCNATVPLSPGNHSILITFNVLVKGGASVAVSVDVDYVDLSHEIYVFSGRVLGLRNEDSENYYVRLVLTSLNSIEEFNAQLRLSNEYSTTPIVIEDGVIVTNTTSWIEVGGGRDCYVVLDVSSETTLSAELLMLLTYSTGGEGVVVYYPLSLSIQSS
ncbi:MAG: hypothetical protein QXP80_01500 [Zestosphaera sp.]